MALVVTVLDEAGSIDALLTSVERQTCQPDEIVVVDGGSTDGTWEKLQSWQGRLRLVLLRLDGASISRGRNAAIAETAAPLIAVTDAGVELDPHWLEELLAHATEADVVSGFFCSSWRTPFEAALGATVLPALEDVRPESFLPSSRSVLFHRAAWEVVGGYPEWLDYCEDLVFDLALRDHGFRFLFAPRARAAFRPRPTPRAFFRQYYLYARGDGKADLWRKRHAMRYLTYLAGPALLFLFRLRALPLLLAGMALYLRRPYQRALPEVAEMDALDRTRAIVWVPALRVLGDVAKIVGYPVGTMWRLRHGRRP